MEPQILPAPLGFEYLEIHGDEAYRTAVLAIAFHPQRGLVPLGMGDKVDNHDNVTALVLPSGQVEQNGRRWPTVAAFLDAKGIEGQSDAA